MLCESLWGAHATRVPVAATRRNELYRCFFVVTMPVTLPDYLLRQELALSEGEWVSAEIFRFDVVTVQRLNDSTTSANL